MSFLSFSAFAFAATIPVVVLFYLLKRKRVVKVVPSTLLWQKYLSETQANAPFQKLRHNWLLLLQILLLLLVVLAISRPFFAGKKSDPVLRVLILDASGSMQSRDVAPTRFDRAREEALKWVDSLRDQDQMVVLQAGANTEVKQSATSSKSALRRAINNTQPTDSPTRIVEALKLAETLSRDRQNAEIHLFSDGAVGDLSEFENKALRLVYHQVGERMNNIGIVTLDVRANPEEPTQRAIYTSIVNPGSNAVTTQLELRFEEALLETKSVTIAPGETSPQVFVASQNRDGVFTVRLTGEDDLSIDNQASVTSLLPQPLNVLLVSKGNRFLEKALRSAPRVELTVQSTLTDAAKEFQLVVLDDVVPLVMPSPNVLAFHVGTTNWFDEWKQVETPSIVDWKNTHPLLRYVNFDNVQVSSTLGVKLPSWGVSLVEGQQTPLILAGEIAWQKIIWIGFDPLQSTWPLRISFPIFIANAVEWLNPASTKASQLQLRAGEPIRLLSEGSMDDARITLPQGGTEKASVDPITREIVFGGTRRQGVYRVEAGTNTAVFCVNLLDPLESNTQPKSDLNLGKFGRVAATQLKRANTEIWRYIAAAGLFVLLFEWWYYHRRTA